MKKFLFSIGLLALMLCLSSTAFADSKKKKQAKDAGTTITLVTSGTGGTKEEATKNALRSALEQTYGAFVSANSTVVNDELVKDEIVSISSGNIVEYEELSFQDTNPKQVTVKSVVSITNLANYAQNKGMAAELAGNTFAMNLKMEELNKQNQSKALKHLFDEAYSMYDRLFDYEIKVSSPENDNGKIQVPITINIKANKNTIIFYDMIHNTLKSLAVGIKSDVSHYYSNEIGYKFPKASSYGINEEAITYVLRGNNTDEAGSDVEKFSGLLEQIVAFGIFNFEVVDNLGNVSGPVPTTYNNSRGEVEVVYKNHNTYFCLTNKLTTKKYGRGNTLMTFRSIRRLGKQLTGDRIQGQVYSDNLALKNGNIMDHWMNKMKPTEGEDLYSWKLNLLYSADEIAKVSKIEIRPIDVSAGPKVN